jgi:hypothetical protein
MGGKLILPVSIQGQAKGVGHWLRVMSHEVMFPLASVEPSKKLIIGPSVVFFGDQTLTPSVKENVIGVIVVIAFRLAGKACVSVNEPVMLHSPKPAVHE